MQGKDVNEVDLKSSVFLQITLSICNLFSFLSGFSALQVDLEG